VTTIRLTPAQKRKLDSAVKILARRRGAHVSRGEAVAELAEIALRNSVRWWPSGHEPEFDVSKDPLFDKSIIFDMGPTDSRKLDDLIYGHRRG